MTSRDKNSVGQVKTQTVTVVEENDVLTLECGKTLSPVQVAYETYGRMNDTCDNVILICHALSGNAHAAGYHSPGDKKTGWWDNMIGPGKAIDTNRFFVICSNFLGGCSGTTGPCSINPKTSRPYGMDFPMVTIADMVKVQKLLLDKLNIKRLVAVIGGSMGGMQVLQWAIDYPGFIQAAVPIATTTHLSPQSIAFDAVGRNAILSDRNFLGGQYTKDNIPAHGLSIARMIGHITYLSEEAMREKFGRKLRHNGSYRYDLNSEFSVETYLDYQGQSFVERFDANSYLYITKAMDYFDVAGKYGSITEAFRNSDMRFLITSFTSDWLFPPSQSKMMVEELSAAGKHVSYCNIESPCGHDAFLLEPEKLGGLISAFLEAIVNPAVQNPPNSSTEQGLSRFQLAKRARVDYSLIESVIEPGSTVLDTGCGQGELLSRLIMDKNIRGKGIEIQPEMVIECVRKSLPIIQHDVELGLKFYRDKSFDYVVLSQTLQTVKNPRRVFEELLRIGKKVIVSFPNFAHYNCRYQLSFKGRAPVTKQLPFTWDTSPNIHFLSLKDFEDFCRSMGVTIEQKFPLKKNRQTPIKFLPNLFAQEAVYVTSK